MSRNRSVSRKIKRREAAQDRGQFTPPTPSVSPVPSRRPNSQALHEYLDEHWHTTHLDPYDLGWRD